MVSRESFQTAVIEKHRLQWIQTGTSKEKRDMCWKISSECVSETETLSPKMNLVLFCGSEKWPANDQFKTSFYLHQI